MLAFLKLLNPKFIIGIILCALIAGSGLYVEHKFSQKQDQIIALQKSNSELIAQNIQLKADVATAVGVNKQDQETINQLSVAASDASARVAEFQAMDQNNAKTISAMRAQIAKSTAKDDGPISNVLLQTLKSIQDNRK